MPSHTFPPRETISDMSASCWPFPRQPALQRFSFSAVRLLGLNLPRRSTDALHRLELGRGFYPASEVFVSEFVQSSQLTTRFIYFSLHFAWDIPARYSRDRDHIGIAYAAKPSQGIPIVPTFHIILQLSPLPDERNVYIFYLLFY